MKVLKKIKNISKKAIEFDKKSKAITMIILVIVLFIFKETQVFADIKGETVKNNLIDEILKPVYTVFWIGMLIKDFIKKNVASIILIIVIGGIIGLFLFYPELIKNVIDAVKGILGL